MINWLGSSLAGLFAGVVAILATVAIERFGGAIGGVLAAIPTTIVPASIGFATQLHDDASSREEEMFRALYAIPPGMFVNALFLLTWRTLPGRLPEVWTHGAKLATVVAASLTVWLGAGAAMWALVGTALTSLPAVYVAGCGATALIFTLGLVVTTQFPVAAPSGSKSVKWYVLLSRGLFSSVSIFVAVTVGSLNSALGGLLSTFPAIFLTTMISLWLSQGNAVPLGAAGPMILASTSVCAYALVYPAVLPFTGVAGSAAVAWFVAVLFVSIPIALFLRWFQRTAAPDAMHTARAAGEVLGDDAFSTVLDDAEVHALDAGGSVAAAKAKQNAVLSSAYELTSAAPEPQPPPPSPTKSPKRSQVR
jgi:hypothetical protein